MAEWQDGEQLRMTVYTRWVGASVHAQQSWQCRLALPYTNYKEKNNWSPLVSHLQSRSWPNPESCVAPAFWTPIPLSILTWHDVYTHSLIIFRCHSCISYCHTSSTVTLTYIINLFFCKSCQFLYQLRNTVVRKEWRNAVLYVSPVLCTSISIA